MQRRKFLATVGSLAAGSAAAMGTGAYSAMSADRVAKIDVVNDEAGLLGIEAGLESDFVSGTGTGQLEISVPDDYGAEGLNDDARYQLGYIDEEEVNIHDRPVTGNWVVDDGDPTEEYAFVITNQDTTSHDITVDGNFGDTSYRASHQAHVALGVFNPEFEGDHGGAQQESAVDSGGGGPTVTVGDVSPGDSVYVAILFDTTRENVEIGSDELDGSFTISAD